MATFKVGQRVRIIAVLPTTQYQHLIGKEGVIVGPGVTMQWMVDVPSCPRTADAIFNFPATHWQFESRMLAPLIDPAADAFLESIKRLKPYEEPKVVRELGTLIGTIPARTK